MTTRFAALQPPDKAPFRLSSLLPSPTLATNCTGTTIDEDCFGACQRLLGVTRCIGGWQPRRPTGVRFPLGDPAPANLFPHSASCAWSGERKRIAVVHMPKTAGEAIVEAIARETTLNFTWVHVDSVELLTRHSYDLYIVTTRDPLAAVVSGFNFVHPIGGDPNGIWSKIAHGGQTPPPLGSALADAPVDDAQIMKAMYDCFPSLPGGVNEFAEALALSGTCADLARRCLHEPSAGCSWMSNGYSYFFGEQSGLLDQLRRAKAARRPPAFFVARSEDLQSDARRLCMRERMLRTAAQPP